MDGILSQEEINALLQESGVSDVREQPLTDAEKDAIGEVANISNILVADDDGTVVGFSHVMILEQKNIACLKPQTAVYIQDLDVLECERNKGIGTLLINASKEYGKRRGADFIRTQVFPQNIDGMRFYERNGFCEMMKTIECQF